MLESVLAVTPGKGNVDEAGREDESGEKGLDTHLDELDGRCPRSGSRGMRAGASD